MARGGLITQATIWDGLHRGQHGDDRNEKGGPSTEASPGA
jgi:hypothetical protein